MARKRLLTVFGLLLVLALCSSLFVTLGAEEKVTIKFWTWTPDANSFKPVIAQFEKLHPDIKIELSLLESKDLQNKVPIALTTGEEVDVVGMQAGAMSKQCSPFLADLEPLLQKYVGAGWTKKYSQKDVAACKMVSDGKLRMLSLCRYGSDIGLYNVAIFKKYGLKVPKTIAEYKQLADTLKAKDPSILPAAWNAKDSWTVDEMMLTVMCQSGDYFNQFRYHGGKVNDPHYISAINGLKKFFDQGIFSKDLLDFDYGRAQEMFTTGKAATYYQGTWEGVLLSSKIRKERKINLEDVGAFALPVVDAGGKPSLRSFLDGGAAINQATKHPKEATQWLTFLMMGQGTDILAAQTFIGTPSKIGAKVDPAMFTSPAARDGVKLMNNLVASPGADRNHNSAFSDVVGAGIQKVLNGSDTAENVVKDLQKEFDTGKYQN